MNKVEDDNEIVSETHASYEPKSSNIEIRDEGNTTGVEELMNETDMVHTYEEEIRPTPFSLRSPNSPISPTTMSSEEAEGEEDEDFNRSSQTTDHSIPFLDEEGEELKILSSKGSEKYATGKFRNTELDRAVTEGVCTFHVTKNTYMLQKWFSCFQCGLLSGKGCCLSCAQICHKGHTGVREYEKKSPTRAYCDCGGKLKSCLCIKKPFISSAKETPIVESDVLFTGSGVYYFRNGDVYSGTWVSGKMHGKGLLTRRTGEFSSYQGDFFENEMTGKGIITFFKGKRYEGEVRNGKANGVGCHYISQVKVYEGQWVDGYYEGHGIKYFSRQGLDMEEYLRLPTLLFYDGQWKRGKRNGKGKKFYRTGKLRYEGEWKNNRYEGQGKVYGAQGELVYDGLWKNGNMHGKGRRYRTITTINEHEETARKSVLRYEGELKENKMDGNGVFYNKDGTVRYMGGFRLGKRHGWGEGRETETISIHYKEREGEGEERLEKMKMLLQKKKKKIWKYVGIWKEDLKHGNGKLYRVNKKNEDILYFEGYFRKGNKDGPGTCFHKNGERFEGMYKAGKRVGTGTKFYKNGKKVYEGEYEENHFHGRGKFWDGQGGLYEGEWRDGKRDGMGTKFYDSEGKKVHYQGEWKRDKRHGTGKNVFEDGSVYLGSWRDNLQCGDGKYSLSHGNLLMEGTWRAGQLEGPKCFKYFSNGERYEGSFVKGKRQGRGKQYFSSGKVFYDGEWANGTKDGFGRCFTAKGELFYEGQLVAGKKQGKGTFFIPDGNVFYKGDYFNNLKHGMGKCFYRDGTEYSGQWEAGVKSGKGKFTFPGGSLTHEGDWRDDKKHGVIIVTTTKILSTKKSKKKNIDTSQQQQQQQPIIQKVKRSEVFFRGEVIRNIPTEKRHNNIFQFSFQYATKEQRNDKYLVSSVLREIGEELEFINDTLKSDLLVVQSAITKSPQSIVHANKMFATDKILVLDLLQVNGEVFFYISSELMYDEDILKAAIRQNGFILEHFRHKYTFFRNQKKLYRDLMYIAVGQIGLALRYCQFEVNKEEDVNFYISQIAMNAVKKDPQAIRYFLPEVLLRKKKYVFSSDEDKSSCSVDLVIREAFMSLSEKLIGCRLEEKIEMLENFFEGLMVSQIAWRNWMNEKIDVKLLSGISSQELQTVKEEVKNRLFTSSEYLNKASNYIFVEEEEEENEGEEEEEEEEKKRERGSFLSERTMTRIITKMLDRVFDIHEVPNRKNQVFLGCVFEEYFLKTKVKSVNLSLEKKKAVFLHFSQSTKNNKTSTGSSQSISMISQVPQTMIGSLTNNFSMRMLQSIENRAILQFIEQEGKQKQEIEIARNPIKQEEQSEENLYNMNGYGCILEQQKKRGGGIIKKLTRKTLFHQVFFGSFQHGLRDGPGKEYTINGQITFDGQFWSGLRHGKGMVFELMKLVPDGKHDHHHKKKAREENFVVYEGMFSLGEKNGRGEKYDPITGRVEKGYWRNGVLDPLTVFTFNCPILDYDGELEENLKNATVLGSGGFGTVYKAPASLFPTLNLPLDKQFVAVKLMKRLSRREVSFFFRITKRGIGLCRSMKSENIINVHAIVKGKSAVGYIMELCNTDVSRVIAASNHSMGIEEKKRILFGTAKGMKVLHDKLVMHRDLKWPNVMISSDNVIKITDFDTLKEDERIWRLQSIAPSSRIGTMGFQAPEVFNGKMYTLACDVFAYGLMIFSLFWEKNVPHTTQYQCSCGHSVENIMQAKLLDYHVARCELRPLLSPVEIVKYPKFLMDLMISCWDADPLKRPSFGDIVHLFESEARKEKCYAVVLLQFPEEEKKDDQIMLLVQPRLKKISDWIEDKFEGSKVLRLKNNKTQEYLEDEEQILKMVEEEDGKHVISVELEKKEISSVSSCSSSTSEVGENEKNLSEEGESVVVLRKELEEVREKFRLFEVMYNELSEKYSDLRGENEELKKILTKNSSHDQKNTK